MKNTDPVKKFHYDSKTIDQRICLFYIAERIRGILADNKTEKHLRNDLQEFENECIHNIGINALMER